MVFGEGGAFTYLFSFVFFFFFNSFVIYKINIGGLTMLISSENNDEATKNMFLSPPDFRHFSSSLSN
jgi:hypothetical protein